MVNDTQQVLLVIGNQDGMYFIFVHDSLNFRNLGLWLYGLWRAGHDVTHGTVEELCLPFLHGPSNVAVSNQSHDFSLYFRYTQS